MHTRRSAHLVGGLTTDAHYVSGAVHVYLDVADAGTPRAKAAGRIVVRDRHDELRVWPFDRLQAPWLGGAAEDYMARAAAEAIDAFGFDGSANRRTGVPSWAPPAEICDLIHDGAERDARGRVVVRPAGDGDAP